MNANATRMLAAGALAVGLLFAMPAAAALGWGVDAGGVKDIKSAGASPAYGQLWVGLWVKSSGWHVVENQLRDMRDQGITPVVMWYYWGDSISVDAVKYGRDGRTKGDWDRMVGEMADRVNAIMGHREWLVVMEPEFNKNGISSYEEFDGYLAEQSRVIKAKAPGARVVMGFGHWGGWDIFDRAMAESKYAGFQILRGSTRDSVHKGENVADDLIAISKQLKSKWGKPTIVYDLGVATYGGWEGVQEKSLQRIGQKTGELEAAGVTAIVWRYMRDNDYSSGYYGPAESSWGVKYRDGRDKPAANDLVALVKGQKTSPPPSGGGGGTPPPSAPPTGSPFSNVKGNDWWIQATVAGNPTKVDARVNGGSWHAMKKQDWGDWAVSTHAPKGSTVELRATFGDGSAKSASYKWPDGTPVGSTPAPTPTQPPSQPPSGSPFSNVKGNDWWIQATVAGNPTKVDARVNGGAFRAMEKKDWGDWAVSMHAPHGSTVELRATFGDGSTKSASYKWPDATPVGGGGGSTPPPSSGGFTASFHSMSGNEWWVQLKVDANKPLSGVFVRVDGGSWVAMEKKSWGDWAVSVHAKKGSKVEFEARSTSGETARSAPTTWNR